MGVRKFQHQYSEKLLLTAFNMGQGLQGVQVTASIKSIQLTKNDTAMKSFTNIFETKIQNKPFFHNACSVWRKARYENNELDIVFENRAFDTYEDCLKECNN